MDRDPRSNRLVTVGAAGTASCVRGSLTFIDSDLRYTRLLTVGAPIVRDGL
jgi:hypothetical protein